MERDTHFTALPLYCTNFNSHAHVERDCTILQAITSLSISTHTLTWSVTGFKKGEFVGVEYFNSHAHVERDAAVVNFQPCQSQFQLTRSRGAWRGSWNRIPCRQQFQLTRSRGAWHIITALAFVCLDISTHTLTWSVTIPRGQERQLYLISTHTLTWSVTCCVNGYHHLHLFQLTRSRGAWLDWHLNSQMPVSISTHTLTWSVTIADCKCSVISYISTHTLTWSVTTTSNWPTEASTISTHTLTWSVTSFRLYTLSR